MMSQLYLIVQCFLTLCCMCAAQGYSKGKYLKSDAGKQNSIIKDDGMYDSNTARVLPLLYSMSREIKLLRNQVSAVKRQNHLIYTNIKKARNTCKPVPENSENPCPLDFVYKPSLRSCYKVMEDKATWPVAEKKCKQLGAHLVSIESAEEQRFLVKQFQKSFSSKHCNYWTSGTDKEREGKWKWSATGKEIKYEKWNVGEPNNGNVDEHCMHMLWYFNWGWNDSQCSVDHSCSVCEIHYN